MSSDILVLGFDYTYTPSEDLAALSVMRKEEDSLKILKVHTGKEAEMLYSFLTGEDPPIGRSKKRQALGVRWK